MPTSRFDSPETLGKHLRVKLNSGFGGANSIVLTPDYTRTGPNPATAVIEQGSSFYLGGGLGILDSLDIEYRSNRLFKVKWQILGNGRLTAEKSNFAVALSGGAGLINDGSSASSSYYSLSGSRVEGALIAGYRPANWLMLYGGPFTHSASYSGEYSTTSATVSSATFSGTGSHYGANLGLEFGTSLFQLKIETAYTKAKAGSAEAGFLYGGAEIAFNFLGADSTPPPADTPAN